MKKVRLDRFWIILGGATVLWTVVGFALLLPKAARSARLHAILEARARELEAAVPGTPSRKDVLSWTRYRENLIQSHALITAFYVDHSKPLHQGFQNLRMAPDGAPPRDLFVARYQDEARILENALAQHAPRVAVGGTEDERAPGFRWEDLSIPYWEPLGREAEKVVMSELQKRYWARQRVANLALSGRIAVKRIVDFRFFKRLHEKFPDDGIRQGEIPFAQWPGLHRLQPQPPPSGQVGLFAFGFALELPYRDVPQALQDFVSPGTGVPGRTDLLVTLAGTHVTIRDQNAPCVDFTYEDGNEKERKSKAAEIERSSKPRTVILTVTCQAVDYEPPQAKELTSK